MERIVEKIADHFNNPEMADRILCVKIREDGWEKLEAASLLRHIRSKTKPSHGENGKAKSSSQIEELSSNEIDKTCGVKDCVSTVAIRDEEKEKNSVTQFESEDVSNGQGTKKVQKRAKCKKQERFPFTEQGKKFNSEEKTENDQPAKGKSREHTSNFGKSEILSENEMSKSSMSSSSNDDAVQTQPTHTSHAAASAVCAYDQKGLTDPSFCKDTEEDLDSTVIKQHQIHVHSFWLSLNSSFFRSLFYSSGMKETKDKQVVINISESLSKMFLLLLESLYRPDVVDSQNVENLLMLMRLAHVYDVERTLKSCQNLLSSSELTVQICDKALNMLDHERLEEMDIFIERCEQFLIQFFSPLDHHWNSEELISLSSTALQKVIGSDDLCVSSENVVFQSVMKWAEVNEVLGESLQPILELVRFRSVTINYLHDMVTSDHPIASTVPSFGRMFEDAIFFHAFSEERRECDEDYLARDSRQILDESILFTWTVELQEKIEFPDGKKMIVTSPPFWVSGYEMFLELKLREDGNQGLYLSICQSDCKKTGKCFAKLKYSLTSNMLKATHVFNEVDVFDKEGAGWGYEEFFPLALEEFTDQIKRTPLIITAQVRLLE